jgi:lipopolysaccharide heptosyltransferase II
MKFLDKYLGWLLCVILSAVEGLVSVFRAKRPAALGENPRILLVKFWGMGSIVLASPLFRAIRAQYPAGALHFLTLSRNREVVNMFPEVDAVHTLEIDRGFSSFLLSFFTMMRTLRSARIDIVMDLEFFTRFSAIVVYLTGAGTRVGFKAWEKWRGNLHLIGVPFNRYWHVSRNFGNLCAAVGIAVPLEGKLAHPHVPDTQREEAEGLLAAKGLAKGQFVCLNPNSGEIALTRRWPAANFAELAKRMIREFPALKVVVIGGQGERDYVAAVTRVVNHPRVVDLSGLLSTSQLAHVIGQSRLLVTNDSGPLHLACAMEVPSVSFFGPETPVLYGPVGEGHVVFYRDMDCSPCINVHEDKSFRCHRRSSQCLEQIRVDEVWNCVRALLNKPAP